MSEIGKRERESGREGDFQLPGRIRILYTDLFYTLYYKGSKGKQNKGNEKGHSEGGGVKGGGRVIC